MRELSVQSASDTNDQNVDRSALNEEFQALKLEIDDIANTTKFNGAKLLNGSFSAGSAAVSADVTNVDLDIAPTQGTVADGVFTVSMSDFAIAADGVVSLTAAGDSIFDLSGNTLTHVATGVTIDLTAAAADAVSAGDTINEATEAFRAALFTNAATSGTVTNTIAKAPVLDSSMTIQTGADKGEELKVGIGDMSTAALKISTATIAVRTDASNSIQTVNTAINTVSTQRAKLGAYQNRLQHKINNLDTSAENLQAAESRIRDLDMAKEMTTYTKNNILVQASTAMLAQANAAPQGVLQLLQ
jgi:flagellin